jgi:hypothetical protein
MGRNDSVSTSTGYGLEGPQIQSRSWLNFHYVFISALEPTQPQPPVQWVPGLFPGRGGGGEEG